MTVPRVLSVAGSDPSGGAGLQVDLRVFQARGVEGMALPTLLTVQTVKGVRQMKVLEPAMVAAQLDALLEDQPPAVIKIGALGNASVVRAVAKSLGRHPGIPMVLDTVILSTSASRLLDDHGVWAMTESLFPMATLITPNADEASVLSRMPVRSEDEMRAAAVALQALGAAAVLVKGGHVAGSTSSDVLFDGHGFHIFDAPRLPIARTHGTGCILSSLIACELAKGVSLVNAVGSSKGLLLRALETGRSLHGVLLPNIAAFQDAG